MAEPRLLASMIWGFLANSFVRTIIAAYGEVDSYSEPVGMLFDGVAAKFRTNVL